MGVIRNRVDGPAAARAANGLAALLFAYFVLQRLWPSPAGVLLQGALIGSISSLLALGIALVYRANRIVNFAQADLGGVPATAAVLLVLGSGWSFWAAIVVGLVVAVATGAFVQKVFIQRFSRAPRLILTVATIGVSQILLAVTAILPNVLVGSEFNLNRTVEPFAAALTVGPITFRGNDIFAFLTVPLVIAALFAFLRFTSTGMAIRASAESAERAALLGVPVARIQTVVWVVAAAVSYWGLLLRTGSIGGLGQLGTGGGTALLTRALAACVIGRMERFGTILAASIGLGILEQSIIWHTGKATDAVVAQFVVLLVALFLQRRGQRRVDDGEVSTWRAITAGRPIPAELIRLPEVVWAGRALRWGLVAVAMAAPWVFNAGRTSLAALVLVYALLGISLVVLTGWAGQVSLGQAAFFGFGGAIGAALSLRSWDLGMALLVAGVAGAVAAVVVGLPALRIRGLYLAVTTLAFSVFATTYLINPDTIHWVPRSSDFIPRRPLFGRIDIGSERAFYYVCLACLGLGILMVRGVRNSRTGRALLGTRDNEPAAQSYGINTVRTKLTAFAIAGFLAAVAGVLYVHSQQALAATRFQPAESLRVFTMVVIGGMGSVPGAIIGSLYLNGTQWFIDLLPDNATLRTLVSFLGTGVGVIVILLVLPAGLGELIYRWRDGLLRVVARRRGLSVPSLTADASAQRAATLASERHAGSGLAAIRQRVERLGGRSATTIDVDRGPGLRLHGVEGGYDGVQVLFGVDLEVRPGEIVALLGTNGAGKSTVLRAISALTPAWRGSVTYDGVDLSSLPPHEIVSHGVSLVPGGRGIFPSLTVRENLRMATWLYRRDTAAVEAAIDETFSRFPVLRQKANVLAGDLSGGQQQMLTLSQSFLTRPRLMMIDELSLGLAPVVVEELIGAVRRMRDAGTTVVLVEQSVNVALTVADRAYFLEKGEVRFEGPTADLLEQPDVLRSVFVAGAAGAEAAPAEPSRRPSRGRATADTPLVVKGLSRSFGGVLAVSDVSFSLARGQILGIIGPNGAGKTTVFDLISGFTTADHGAVVLESSDVTGVGPDVRARMGLGRSFQDARLFSGLTVSETIALALERQIAMKDPLAAALNLPAVVDSERAIARRVDELVELLNLGAFRDKFIAELSTGSRRIVDLACVIAHQPSVLLLDEPSSGIAQRETEALGPLIARIQRETGTSILIIEHDMPLISSVADELIAMHLGQVLLRGKPPDVLNDDRVVETYLGTHDEIINRSGTNRATRRPVPPRAPRRRQLVAAG